MIVDADYLETIRGTAYGNDIVFTTGCFNLYHPGHVIFLERAKQFGKILTAAVAHDDITKVKRVPALNQAQRMYMVDSHKAVDYVVAEEGKMPPRNVSRLVRLLRPKTWVTNDDNPNLQGYKATCDLLGVKLEVLGRINTGIFDISTTELIRRVCALENLRKLEEV